MPVLNLFANGLTAGIPPLFPNVKPGKKSAVQGWSASSARSNRKFLYAVDFDSLSGVGFACTFTFRDCPETHDESNSIRLAFIKRMKRIGLIRSHWVIEWQKRGVPHYHAMLYFPSFTSEISDQIVDHWLALTKKFRTSRKSQFVTPIYHAAGFAEYVAKHASRGFGHYQREKELIPEGWQKTGRMWGYTGDWNKCAPTKVTMDISAFHTLRRIYKNLEISRARSSGDIRRLKYARKMNRGKSREQSTVRGMSNFLSKDMQAKLLFSLVQYGYLTTRSMAEVKDDGSTKLVEVIDFNSQQENP